MGKSEKSESFLLGASAGRFQLAVKMAAVKTHNSQALMSTAYVFAPLTSRLCKSQLIVMFPLGSRVS
jgi:ADP-ribosylglycohydrolase